MTTTAARSARFVLVVYRMPTKPTAGRVAVWRQLKKIGAIYLHQSVCVFPDTSRTRRELQPIRQRIEQAGGEYHLLPLRQPSDEEYDKLVAQFVDQTSRRYSEIIENCEVNFQKEIEFETFRQNFTYEEAEEIRIEFDKICNWFEQVKDRDWFGAPNKGEAKTWLDRCEGLLEQFEARVYEIEKEAPSSSTARKPRRNSRRARVITMPVRSKDAVAAGSAAQSSP
jgi:hypothetical protein